MKRIRFFLQLLFALSVLCCYSVALAQQEEITSFESDITVQADSTLRIEERITVRSFQKKIKRGIYRDLPTVIRDSWGFRYQATIELEEVLRDGVPEHAVVEDIVGGSLGGQTKGIRIRIGRKEKILPPGDYEYTIRYTTVPQLRYFDDFDELYWNVTGNGWEFPIRMVNARVRLPDGVPSEQVKDSAYTGVVGSTESAVRTFRLGPSESIYRFQTTRFLEAKEGLTISVSWPKGYVWEPSATAKRNWWIESNRGQIGAIAGLLVVLIYYLCVWLLVGRDPPSATILARYKAPDGLSAGEVRFLDRMGFDQKVLTAEIVHLATLGALRIEKSGSSYSLHRLTDAKAEITTLQARMLDVLFGGTSFITVQRSNYKTFQRAREILKKGIRSIHLKRHFRKNSRYFLFGIVMSFFVLGLSAWMEGGEALAITLFMSVWLSGWTLGVFFLVSNAVQQWRDFLFERSLLALPGAIFISLFSLPFLAGEVFGVFMLYQATSLLFVLAAVGLGASGYLFHWLLKQPTIRGQKLMDQINGLRLYLSVAEEDRMKRSSEPEQTFELFERFLPFAVALNVEQEWADKFASLMEQAGEGAAESTSGYTPSFYRGTSFSDVASVGSALGAGFSSAISGASSSPSSSGSGGGGSSGGGGGGGGGGGW